MFFVWLDRGDVVLGYDSKAEALQQYKEHLAQGHPAARSATVHEAPDELTFRQAVIDRREIVRLVCAGIPSNFYDSDEWAQQQADVRRRRLERGGWDCGCGEENDEDVAYCPGCGHEGEVLVAERRYASSLSAGSLAARVEEALKTLDRERRRTPTSRRESAG